MIVLAFVFLFGFVVFPVIPQLANAPVFDRLLGAVLCAPGATLVRDQYSQSFGGEQSFSMLTYCQDAQGERIDVTDKWTQIGIVGYLVLFLPGMYVTTGTLSKKKPVPPTKKSSVAHHAGESEYRNEVVTYGGVELGGNNLTSEQIEAFKRRVRAQSATGADSAKVVTTGVAADLSAKLKQAQEAHDNGLISDDEYSSLRQSILDDLK